MKKSEEIWKDVIGYEGVYYVSSFGRVKNSSEKLMSFHKCNGYFRLELNKKGKPKKFFVHRLVIEAFKGLSSLVVNHIDGDKLNNCLENLEYCTQKENIAHDIKSGLFKVGENAHRAKLTLDQVYIVHMFSVFMNNTRIAEYFNITPSAIGLILSGKNWGHIWES